MTAGSGLIELEHAGLRLGVLPSLGGCLTHFIWRHPAGNDVDLMRRSNAKALTSGNPSDLASFPMLPFANRIDGGRLPLRDGSVVQLPLNRPAQNVAIHGFGRTASWEVIECLRHEIRLRHQQAAGAGQPYAYVAEQHLVLGTQGLEAILAVTNRGARELPFGIGFHPWFDRTPDARLEIAAASAFEMDERQMPVRAIPFETVSGGGTSFNISERMPFDTPLAGWSGRAAIHWPSRRTRLSIEATPALGLAHIFAPVTPEVFCVEPVSHMPDVVNRRHLAVHGDMTTLAPGETLAGSMTLRAEAFSG